MRQQVLPPGRFRYEFGSYGGPGRGYAPSIKCYKQAGPDLWESHFCLIKSDAVLEDEDSASSIAEEHLVAAHKILNEGGGPQDFALFLRHAGYKSVSGFHVISNDSEEGCRTNVSSGRL